MIYLAYLFIAYWIITDCVILFVLIRDWKETKEDLTTASGLIIIGPLFIGLYLVWEIIIEPIFNHTIWIKKTKQRIENDVVDALPKALKNYNEYFEKK